MRQVKTFGVLILLFCSSLAGCLSQTLEESNMELVVEPDSKNGTIVESYSDGEYLSTENVILDFDFSLSTASNRLVTFGIDTGGGQAPITVDAASSSIVTLEFSNHGMYELSAYAIDEEDNRETQTITVRIELRIEWVESNTNNPQTLVFDPTPKNGGQNPIMIEIYSIVENPSLIDEIGGSGQTVQFTWNIADEQDDVCQSRSEQVSDGEEVHWNAIHFNTFQIHELRISYDDGQDYIQIDQSVSILYDSEDA